MVTGGRSGLITEIIRKSALGYVECLVLGMGRTIIHVGMPRAASTFFQRALFPYVSGFRYVGVDESQYSDHFQKLLYQDDSLYESAMVAAAFADARNENLLLSNELFVGQSLYLNSTNRTRNAVRLFAIFPDAEILIVLRNQVDLLQSLYSIGIYSGHSMSPKAFIRFSNDPSTSENPRYPTFHPSESTEIYNYSELIKLYKKHFPKVHVVLYEDFAADPKAFTLRLLSVLNMTISREIPFSEKVNRSLSARQLYFFKILNRWKPFINRGKFGKRIFGTKQRFVEKRMGGGKGFAFDPALREKIQNTFKADNRLLIGQVPELDGNEYFKQKYLS